MKKTVRTAPRMSETAAAWYKATFENLNQGLEYMAESWPPLYKKVLKNSLGKFSANEKKLMLDVFNATWLTPGMAGLHLEFQVDDGCTIDGLDRKWDVDKNQLVNKIKAMTIIERAVVELWATAYWLAGHWEKKSPEEYIQEGTR